MARARAQGLSLSALARLAEWGRNLNGKGERGDAMTCPTERVSGPCIS